MDFAHNIVEGVSGFPSHFAAKVYFGEKMMLFSKVHEFSCNTCQEYLGYYSE